MHNNRFWGGSRYVWEWYVEDDLVDEKCSETAGYVEGDEISQEAYETPVSVIIQPGKLYSRLWNSTETQQFKHSPSIVNCTVPTNG